MNNINENEMLTDQNVLDNEALTDVDKNDAVIAEEELDCELCEDAAEDIEEEEDDGIVLKPIGVGGPVPIIAPRSNVVQLQPIVVPLALVPYMSQETAVLQTEPERRRPARSAYDNPYAPAATASTADDAAEDSVSPVEFDSAEEKAVAKARRKCKVKPRVFGAVTFVLSALTVLPFILSYFMDKIVIAGKTLDLDGYNIIETFMDWAASGALPAGMSAKAVPIVYAIAAGMGAIALIAALIAVISGKYPKVFMCLTTLISAGGFAAVLAYGLYNHFARDIVFDPKEQAILIALVAAAVLSFILAAIFSAVLKKDENRWEDSDGAML